MLTSKLILVIALLLFTACSTEHTTATRQEPLAAHPDTAVSPSGTSSTVNFQAAFTAFFEALQKNDTTAINRFIHPEHGLWIIEQPGALPKMTQVFQVQQFRREFQDRSFFTIATEVQQCNLSEEAFPEFDCADMNYEAGKSGYSKDGCFVWGADKLIKSGYWDYANLSKDQIQSIKDALPLVQRSVLHTKTSFEFHFGYLAGQWYLLFAKLIYPCSA